MNKEFWNIPKTDEVLSIPQGTNLTVFVDHAEKITYFGLEVTEWTALFSIFIAAISIFMAWKANKLAKSEADANKKYNRLSVRPFLVISCYFNDKNSKYKVELKNIGLGPAIISSFNVYPDKKARDKSKPINDLGGAVKPLQLKCPEDAIIDSHINPEVYSTTLDAGFGLQSNGAITLLELDFRGVSYRYDWIEPILMDYIRLDIGFTDLYGEYNGEWSSDKST